MKYDLEGSSLRRKNMEVMGLSGFVKNKIETRLTKDSLQVLEMFLVPTYRSSFTSTKGRFS